MRTLVVSDLHLGNGGDYDVFAGGHAFPALMKYSSQSPTRVIINGDGLDFLMNDDPLELDAGRAADQARAIAAAPASSAALRALGHVLAAGGEVIFRLGNHDVELALPEVQSVLRGALGQPAAIADRLTFQLGDAPALLDVGGARVVVTHGEHDDPWNRVDYAGLSSGEGFRHSAGSALVKRVMNPLIRDHGLRFVSLLKPDFQGGALTALAVAPAAVKLLFRRASLDIVWQLLRKVGRATSFDGEDESLGLADRVAEAGLDGDEADALEALLGDGPAAFSDEEDGVLSRALLKLARGGLELYAGAQRRLTGESGARFFELDPEEREWAGAQRLARKLGADAVIVGHTHAARWKEHGGVVLANTGTWIWLMELPPFDAGDAAWANFITELRRNPAPAPSGQGHARLVRRLTAVLIEPRPRGASMLLLEWDGARARALRSAEIPPAATA